MEGPPARKEGTGKGTTWETRARVVIEWNYIKINSQFENPRGRVIGKNVAHNVNPRARVAR